MALQRTRRSARSALPLAADEAEISTLAPTHSPLSSGVFRVSFGKARGSCRLYFPNRSVLNPATAHNKK